MEGLNPSRYDLVYDWDLYEWFTVEHVCAVYDGMRVLQERNGDNNTPTVSYTRGTDLSGSLEGTGGIGGLLARSHGYSGGNWSTHSFYHADGGGNVTYLVNASQGLAGSYKYDPYGRVTSQSGALSSANLYRFSSKEVNLNYPDAGGLYYYGYRWYAPNLQRWLNRDPLGDEASFVYSTFSFEPRFESVPITVGKTFAALNPEPFENRSGPNIHSLLFNDPANLIDPRGLDCWSDFLDWGV